MSPKFGLRIVFYLLKARITTSTNTKPEVVLRRHSKCDEFKNDRKNHTHRDRHITHGTVRPSIGALLMTAKFKESMETVHVHVTTGFGQLYCRGCRVA